MTYEDFEWLASVVAAHPNKKVNGRTRLQKTIKLLQRMNFPTSYGFSIHYYGPYSEELQSDIGLLDNFGLISEKEHINTHGSPSYTIQSVSDDDLPDISQFKDAISKMAGTDPVVLELAATYDAFVELGCDADQAMERLKRKKGTKCEDGRADQALGLLRELGLQQQVRTSRW